jgi:hypothetical protein
MNDNPNHLDLDETDEETLTYEVSDEALEAAARGTERRGVDTAWATYTPHHCNDCPN